MILGLVYLFLLLGGTAVVLIYGERYERIAILVVVVGSVLSLLMLLPVENRWARMETNILLIDVAAIFIFFVIALRSARIWPLWLTGLQIVVAASHVVRFYYPTVMPAAYSAGESLWAYLQILILIVVAFRIRRAKNLRTNKQERIKSSSPD